MSSVVGICNLALQLLGDKNITSITEDSARARECNTCYESIRDAELVRHNWNFAIKRAQLPALADAPAFGFTVQCQLPSDCLRPIFPNTKVDWVIEGRKLLTNAGAPVDIRYMARVTDPNEFNSAFIICLAARMADHMCERITQSNQKKADAKAAYKDALTEARRTNAIEKLPEESEEDDWVSARGTAPRNWVRFG